MIQDYEINTPKGSLTLHKGDTVFGQYLYKLDSKIFEFEAHNGMAYNVKPLYEKLRSLKKVEGWSPYESIDLGPGNIISNTLDGSQLITLNIDPDYNRMSRIGSIGEIFNNFNVEELQGLDFILKHASEVPLFCG